MKSFCQKIFRLFFIVFLLFFATGVFSSSCFAEIINSDSLLLIQINLENKLGFESEIFQDNENNIYLPVKQIISIIEAEAQFSISEKKLVFKSSSFSPENPEISLDGNKFEILINNQKLQDTNPALANNKIYWVNNSLFLKDEILVSLDLIQKFFDIELKFDQENMTLFISVKNRQLNKLARFNKKTNNNTGEALLELTKPIDKKIFLKNLGLNFTSYGSLNQSVNYSEKENNTYENSNMNNSLNIQTLSEIWGGEYRIGPSFYIDKTGNYNLSGFKQTWRKILNDSLAVELGDTSFSFNNLSGGGNGLGFRIGSPNSLGYNKQQTGLDFSGACSDKTEIFLLLNNIQVESKICENSGYKFKNIKYFTGQESSYKIIQRNQDNSEIVLYEEKRFFHGNFPKKGEKSWQFGVTRPPIDQLISNKLNNKKTNFINKEANKIETGASFEIGLQDNLALEISGGFDHKFELPANLSSSNITNSFNPEGISGQNLAFLLRGELSENFNFSSGLGLSNSYGIENYISDRTGLGFASFFNYSLKKNNFNNSGFINIASPSFYSIGSPRGNYMSAGTSTNFKLKNHAISASVNSNISNLQEQKVGDKTINNSLNISHSYNFQNQTGIQSSFNFQENSSDLTENRSMSMRSALNKTFSNNLSGDLNIGFTQQESLTKSQDNTQDNKNNTKNTYSFYDIGAGLNYSIGDLWLLENNNASLSLNFLSNQTVKLSARARSKYKKISFQPSVSVFKGKNNTTGVTLGNGIFWQTDSGSRIGLSYSFSRSDSELAPIVDSYLSSFGTVLTKEIQQKNKNINHTLSLTMSSDLGFAGKVPHVVNNKNSGYLSGIIFIDSNKNNIQDNREAGASNIIFLLDNKEVETDIDGKFVIYDIPEGQHEVKLDVIKLPMTVTPLKSNENFLIETGKETKVFLTINMNNGTISGKIHVKDIKNTKLDASDLLVLAKTEDNKDASYTYTDKNGNYILSDLTPGKYSIELDKIDLEQKNLTPKEKSKIVEIPLKIDSLIRVENVDFQVLKSLF